ncbi:glycosyltransferase family 4 protein [Thermodesulfobacteriota bacterium]
MLIEITPHSWQSALFDQPPQGISAGIIEGRKVFNLLFSKKTKRYWQHCASFNFVVYDNPKTLHPTTWKIGLKTTKFIQKIAPDIIHFDGGVGLRLIWNVWRLRNIPIFLSVHDAVPHRGEKKLRKELIRWMYYPFVNKFVLHNNEMTKIFMEKYKISQSKICFQPLGIYHIYKEWIDGPIEQMEKTILFFGRISPYKGIEVLYSAMPKVAEKIPGVRFIIAGRPISGYSLPEPPLLKGDAKVEVIDEYIPNQQLGKLFMEATVVVCPYIDATQSGVVLTAYAFKRPVVATKIGGLPDYVKHEITGLIVDPNDDYQLAEALIRILKNRDFRLKLEKGIEDMASNVLKWDNIAENTVAIYNQSFN